MGKHAPFHIYVSFHLYVNARERQMSRDRDKQQLMSYCLCLQALPAEEICIDLLLA